jgi:CYTH domain-containing protein
MKKKINNPPLEIERKFILKRLPNFDKKVELLEIVQFYIKKDGETVRYRRSSGNRLKYFLTIKEKVSKGIYIEHEKQIQQKQFVIDLSDSVQRKIIEKTRYVYKYKGLKFEVDLYHKMSLITLEVELKDIKQNIDFPDCIKREIIMEVTGKKAFSNYSLAEEHRGKIVIN